MRSIILPFAVLLSTAFVISCEKTNLEPFDPSVDAEFDKAEVLVDEFLEDKFGNELEGSQLAREKVDVHITVLLFDDEEEGELYYNTNRDSEKGFRLVNEETVTADVKPGDYVVWIGAGHIRHIEGIVFDEESEEELEELPKNHKKSTFWYIQIPEAIDGEHLKYDIIYQVKGDDDLIRLDPKLKIDNE